MKGLPSVGSAGSTYQEENDSSSDEVGPDGSCETVGHVNAVTEGLRPGLRSAKCGKKMYPCCSNVTTA